MALKKIEIRSEEIDEILGKAPNKIIRQGITVIFIIILILLAGSWFFKYPDSIKSSIEITTTTPPANIIARSSGKFQKILVHDNEKVYNKQYLAIIQNTANYKDVKKLITFLDSIDNNLLIPDIEILLQSTINNLKVGEIQPYLSSYITTQKNYFNFVKLNYYPKKIKALEKEIADYHLYYNYTYDQKQTVLSDFKLSEKDYNRHLQLYNNRTIAESELEEAKSKFLNKKYAYENNRTSLANINIQISQLKNNLLDLQLQSQQQKEKLILDVEEASKNLKAQIFMWEQKYVLKASINGLCSFTKYWDLNQNVKSGEEIMTIIPETNNNKIIGRLLLPVQGAGKVKVGQKVNIKLLNYPYMEYGMVKGVIEKISLVPVKNYYYVEVKLPEGLKTNYGINLRFSQNMQGSAEIITKNIKLLYRIIKPIRSLVKNKSFKKVNIDNID